MQQLKTHIYVLFLLIGCTCTNTAQEKFTFFDEDIGYSSHSFHIIQDDYGFLWSGTLTGLIKTDGYEYKKFTTTRGDSSTIALNFTSYVFEDRFSNIWANSYLYGLSIYDRSEDRFIRIKASTGEDKGLKSKYITSIIEMNDSTLFVCGDAGLEKVTLTNENYTDLEFELFEIDDSKKISNEHLSHIWHGIKLKDNEILLSSVMGFFLFDVQTETFQGYEDVEWIPSGIGFSTCYDSVRHQLWIAVAGEELKRYDFNSESYIQLKDVAIPGNETYLFQSNTNELLLKINGADLFFIDLNTLKFTRHTSGSNSDINHRDRWSRRFTKTHDGSLFIASSDDSRFQHIPSIEPKIEHVELLDKADNSVAAVFEDDDFFVACFFKNGIYVRSKRDRKVLFLNTSNSLLVDNLIMNVIRLRDGRFVFLGQSHAYCYDYATGKLRIISDALFFRNAIERMNGELWLFAGAGGGAHVFKQDSKNDFHRVSLNAELRSIVNYRDAIENKDSSMWMVSSGQGLLLISNTNELINQWRADADVQNSLVGDAMECLYKGSNGIIWAGSLEGLSKFDPIAGEFTNYTITDGFEDTSISAIVEDEEGRIWVSTFDGIYYYDDQLNRFRKSNDSHVGNKHFSQRGVFKYGNKIYFCGDNGIDIMRTNESVRNLIPPKIQLTNIYKDGNRQNANNLELIQTIEIRPEERKTSLEFAAIHYGSHQMKKYEYRLSNSSNWIDFSDDRRIPISDFEYGNYKLEVRGSNAHGVWSEIKKYYLILPLPWYNSLWFYSICILGLMMILYGAYRWKLNQEVKIREQQLEIDRQIAEIELKALKAQMNPHFVFNSINSVKALILEQKTSEAIVYLTSFSELIRKILNNSNDKFIRLQDEVDTIELYLELEALRFDEAFKYVINIGEEVSTDFIEVPALILQPYIENAIWHGLLHKEKGPKLLRIDIQKNDDKIEIVIDDNGIGRAAAMQIKTRSKSKNQSLGLTINSQRIDLLRQLYGNEASIEILDLKSNNVALGTRVVVKFDSPD